MQYKRIHGRNHYKKHYTPPFIHALGDHQEDFKTEKEASKKWMESHKLALDQNITSEEKKAIDILHTPENNKDSLDINKILKETGGLVSLPITNDSGDMDDNLLEKAALYNDNINKVDKAFTHLSGKIPGKMYVYKEMDMLDFGYNVPISEINDNELTKTFEQNYTFGLVSEFLKVKPYYEEKRANTDNSRRVLLKLSLPKGTNVIPADNETLYLSRNSGINITNMSIVVLNGQDALRIEAEFASENENTIKEKIIDRQDIMNEIWNETLDLSTELDNEKIFEFIMGNQYASGAIEHMAVAMRTVLIANSEFAKKITQYLQKKEWKIVFTDQLLGYLAEYLFSGFTPDQINDFNEDLGSTFYGQQRILLSGSAERALVRDDDASYNDLSRALFHEMTHAADFILGVQEFGDGLFSEQSKEFIKLYHLEKDNLTAPLFEYAKSNPTEYFAEVYALLNTKVYNINGVITSIYLKQKIPETVKFINEKIKGIYFD
ncbi:TPA: hypothetical protein ACSPOR_004570 [Bacillus cereus]|uniref:hypothetical protein n=1 Tax=Bacillus cereus TaxID=1396 RepID=UPI00065B5710|nr:hypothetical protein [Bacillus cereus]KMQ22171.1 hypothetical protein TU58_30445 [Bacillus cereus]